jgi:hypothetical protein
MGEGDDILVIRVWREPGREAPFRARVLSVGASLEHIHVVLVATSTREVLGAVVDWLGDCASGS